MIRSTSLIAILFVGACSAARQPADQASSSETDTGLRIAAWNIEHLAAEPGLGCEPRGEAGYELVADVIVQVDADIWLLQEIENQAALERVFDPDEWTFHVEDRPDTGPKPQCYGRNDRNRLRMQRTAIVIRDGIQHTRGEDLSALDVGGRGFLRHGVTVTVDHGDIELDLMSIHLKSGCFSGDRSDDCPRLFDQIPVLEAWIDERGEDGRAVIVGGDFNRRLTADGDTVWADLDDGAPVDLIVAGEGITPMCDLRYNAFIDFIVINEFGASLMKDDSFAETTFEVDQRASDHCPISVELR